MIAALLFGVAVLGLSFLLVLFLGRMADGRDQQVPRDPRDGDLEQSHRYPL